MSELEPLDLREKGRDAAGHLIHAERRLYLQLLAFGRCTSTQPFFIGKTVWQRATEGAVHVEE